MLVQLRCRHEKENLLFQRHFFIPISILYDFASTTKKKVKDVTNVKKVHLITEKTTTTGHHAFYSFYSRFV
jgi:hypothetical protein